MTDTISPNTNGAATEQSAVPSLDSIASKMTAMREQTERNLIRQQAEQTATGQEETAESSSPVVPEGTEVVDSNDSNIDSDNLEADAQPAEEAEVVSTDSTNSTAEDLIDFLDFADTNPNAKFKFMRNGKEVVIDAKKAASILGQGSAIHEDRKSVV